MANRIMQKKKEIEIPDISLHDAKHEQNSLFNPTMGFDPPNADEHDNGLSLWILWGDDFESGDQDEGDYKGDYICSNLEEEEEEEEEEEDCEYDDPDYMYDDYYEEQF